MDGKQKSRFQCMHCGHLHWIEDPPNIDEDELYVELRCSRCKQTGNHLCVGNTPEDAYIYYDVTKDNRYY